MNKTPEMGSNWSENSGATEHVLRLLEESGALLESHVFDECEAFARSSHNKLGVRVKSDSVTYGLDTQDSPLREIDQNVSLYKEFILDGQTGVQLKIEIPIEAKFRRNVEVFGLDYPARSYRPRMPMQGFVLGTALSAAIQSLSPFQSFPLCKAVLLEIKNGSTPEKHYGENLIHNAANALYDFVRFEFGKEEQEDASPETQILLDMRLIPRFETYLQENRYAWWSVIYRWMNSNLSDTLVNEFNRQFGSERIYRSLEAFCPVLCINGPIWHRNNSRFEKRDALVTRVRVSGWPGVFRHRLVRYTAEAPLIVTNVSGLRTVLDNALHWFKEIEKALRASDKKVQKRWPIESAFYSAAVEHFLVNEPSPGLRSDLDYFEIMQMMGLRERDI